MYAIDFNQQPSGHMREFIQLLVPTMMIFSLFGCVSAGFTSASLIYDNYDLQQTVADHLLDLQADQNINNLNKDHQSQISAITMDNTVLLIGQTYSKALRLQAEKQIKALAGVKRVLNQINIGAPLPMSQKIKDTFITTKLKLKLFNTKEVDGKRIKVVTENSVVYLMGTVPAQQVAVAVYLAQQTGGVKKVVKVLRQTIVVNTT